jgi:hypothetical protein
MVEKGLACPFLCYHKNMEKMRIKRSMGLIAYVTIASLVVLWLRPVYLLSICIVLVPPAITTFLWVQQGKVRIMAFSVASTLLFAPAIELATRLANAWDVRSIIPRPFGLIPIENMLFAFINFFWVISFYEYFSATKEHGDISNRIYYLLGLFIVFSSIVFSLFYMDPALVTWHYAWIAVPILIIPAALLFGIYPELIKKTIPATLFFAYTFFIYEVVSLIIGSWWWPGEYLFTVSLFGNRFPLDDVLIWYFLSTPVLIAGYEVFAKGYKRLSK